LVESSPECSMGSAKNEGPALWAGPERAYLMVKGYLDYRFVSAVTVLVLVLYILFTR
jgi:hypothetical protein